MSKWFVSRSWGIVVVGLLIILTLAAYSAAARTNLLDSGKLVAVPTIVNVPFTVLMSYSEESDRISKPAIVARNTQGTLVEERSTLPITGGKIRIITSRGSRVVVDPVTESITTTYPGTQARELAVKAACTHSKEEAEILGIQVFKAVIVLNETDRSVVYERWIAPKLGCIALQSIWSEVSNGKRTTQMSEAISVSLAEPPLPLFEIPATYRERSPSERAQELSRRFPVAAAVSPCSACATTESIPDAAYRWEQIK